MSLHSEFNQLYFDFVYSDYFNKYSEFKYLLDLINQIDWSAVPEFNNPLRTSSKKPLVGDCGKPLSLHSHYRETKRNILRNKYVCDDPSNCPLNKYNCYAYRNFSKDDFRRFLNRDSSSFKKVYKKRTLIESIFSKLADMTNSTSLRCKNAVEVECNLSNLYLIASAFLAHSMGRDDLLASPKTLMYETAVC